MEGAAPAAPLPARGHLVHVPLGGVLWLLVAVLCAAGGGLLAITHEQLAVDLALVGIAAIALYLYPLPALLVLLVVAPKHSPFVELLFLGAAGLVALWRLPFLPARAMLAPLLVFVLFALPGVAWDSGYIPAGTGLDLLIPGVGFAYLETPSVEGFEWLRLAFVLVAGVVAVWQVTSMSRFRLVAGTAVVAAIYPIAEGLKQLATGELVTKGDFNAVRGSFNFPNEYGVYLVLFILLAIVAMFELRQRWVKVLAAALAGAGLLMLLHSYTRSAWIGFAVGLMLVSIVKYRSLIGLAFVLLVVATIGFPNAVEDVQSRFGDLASQNAANSKNSLKWRRGQWDAMAHYGWDRPLTGQGFGSYRRKTVEEFGLQGKTYGTVQDTQQTGRLSLGFTAHNDFVKHWVETGAIGLVLWVAFLIGIGVTQIHAMRVRELLPWATALLGTTMAYVIMSFSDNIQAYTVPMFYLVVLTAALAGAARASRISAAVRPSS